MINVLLADPQEIVRQGIKLIFDMQPGANFSFTDTTSCEGLSICLSKQTPQLAILEIHFSDGNIFSIVEDLFKYNRGVNVLIYTSSPELMYAKRFFDMGVLGFLNKNEPLEELDYAITKLIKGEMYISAKMQKQLFSKNVNDKNIIHELSKRELEVIEYISLGMGSKEIAIKMHLDITTISTYRRRSFEKIGVKNAIELKEKMLFYKQLYMEGYNQTRTGS